MKRLALLLAFAAPLFPRLALAACDTPTDPCLDTERLKPAVTSDGWVSAEGSGVRSTHDRWDLGGFLQYGRDTLVTVDSSRRVTRAFVSGRMGLDLFASVTVAGPFALGLDVPLFLLQTGDASPSFAGLGDVRIVPKLRILDDEKGPFGLGLVLEVRAPTHLGDYSGGTRIPVFAPRLILDHRFGGLRLGTNVGVMLRQRTDFYDVVAGSEFVYTGDIAYRFGGKTGKVELGVEANGALGLLKLGPAEAPLEALPYLRIDPSPSWDIQLGGGLGLLPGYGVPLARAFFGLRFHPGGHEGRRDADREGHRAADRDSDHDGIPDDRDKCPYLAEDRDGVLDADGCPEKDADKDGIPDGVDKCPTQKETINGYKDDDGCPDEGPAKVAVEQGRITITEKIRFRSGSAEIDPESHSILNQIALTMRAHPEIRHVRIEGHTDETGTRELNVQLSKDRAAAVRQYLIAHGVNGSRLSSEGYGPDRPIAHGTDEESRAKNRRVDFVIQ